LQKTPQEELGVKNQKILTARLCLQVIDQQDFDALITLLKNEKIAQTYMVPSLSSREDERKLFDAIKRTSQSSNRFAYGIFWEDVFVGLINDVGVSGSEIELGFVIHPDYQGKGFATEALTALTSQLFALGFSTVKTAAFEHNAASIRVMEKCGMTRLDDVTEEEYRGKTHRCVWFEKRC
jgi:RimJ/RimL family protein N-acetyltransferase